MSTFLTELPAPMANRQEIGGTVIETVRGVDGRWLYRCPEIYPVNARHWRGSFEFEAQALTDYRDKTRVPRITRAELRSYKHHGYHGVVDGRERIMRLCPLTGATSLTTFEMVAEASVCLNT